MGEAAQDTTKAAETEIKPVAEAQAKPAEATKPAEAPPEKVEAPKDAKPVVPEKYDLKLPEGSFLKADTVEKIATFAKEHGFSNEQAQKLLEDRHSALAEYVESNKKGGENWNKTLDIWESQVKEDKEIGGTPDKIKETSALARKGFEKFFDPKLMSFLDESGLGSHPEVLRGLSRIGRALSNDTHVLAQTPPSQPKKSLAERFYGNTENKE